MIRFLDHTRLAEELCKALGKWGLYISFDTENDAAFGPNGTLERDAPYFIKAFSEQEQEDENNPQQCFFDGCAVILCDTKEEMEALYNQTRGDDDGDGTVYALTIGPDGYVLNENT